MDNKFKFKIKVLAASVLASGTGVPLPVLGQDLALEEVIVTARRRDESLQQVPLSVVAVSGDELNDYNIQNFEDLEQLVAGLSLEEDSIAPNAAMRGVRFDTFSGTTPTVVTYLNDASTSPLTVMQYMFDVGQIEVLRGPQGTLRGRASPSGSITVRTAQAQLDEMGGFVDGTTTTDGNNNINGALNVPVIKDQLAVRFSGFYEENDINNVSSIYTGDDSSYSGNGYRLSVNYQPTDSLSIQAIYQRVRPHRDLYTPVESANIANPGLPPSDPEIRAKDRRSVQDISEESKQNLQATIVNLSWNITNQHQFNYVGGWFDEVIRRTQPIDATNAIDDRYPEKFQGLYQKLYTDADTYTQEFRLQSIEPLFDGKLDYVVGGLYTKAESHIEYSSPNLIDLPFFTGVFDTIITNEPPNRSPDIVEKSFFLNLTYHFTDRTELSAGARYIDYKADSYLEISNINTVLQDEKNKDNDTVYLASLRHNFTDDLMTYFTYGSSWRAGANVVGDRSTQPSETQDRFRLLPSETSDSYEVGMKSMWLDNTLRLNLSAYYQEFNDYPFRPPTGVYYRTYSATGSASVGSHNFVSPVPVNVAGFELEADYAATDRLSLGALVSYSKGKVDDGEIACNDYDPHDGQPDSSGVPPTLDQIVAAAGDQNLTTCTTNQRTNFAPDWASTLTAQYDFPVGGMDGYVRGLWSLYGDSDNDPTNPLDDVDSYNILNLYAGLGSAEGTWQAMVYVKNVADTVKVINRFPAPGSIDYADGGDGPIISDYREIGLSPEREYGLNLRYNF